MENNFVDYYTWKNFYDTFEKYRKKYFCQKIGTSVDKFYKSFIHPKNHIRRDVYIEMLKIGGLKIHDEYMVDYLCRLNDYVNSRTFEALSPVHQEKIKNERISVINYLN